MSRIPPSDAIPPLSVSMFQQQKAHYCHSLPVHDASGVVSERKNSVPIAHVPKPHRAHV